MPEHAEERFLHRQAEPGELDTLHIDFAADQGRCAIVVTAGEGYRHAFGHASIELQRAAHGKRAGPDGHRQSPAGYEQLAIGLAGEFGVAAYLDAAGPVALKAAVLARAVLAEFGG